jgi:hypothetical protein
MALDERVQEQQQYNPEIEMDEIMEAQPRFPASAEV